MRAIFNTIARILFLATVLATPVQARTLEECLQIRLDHILAGDNVEHHTNINRLLYLTIGRGNYLEIEYNSKSLKLFEKTVSSVMKKRISERAGEFSGAVLSLADTGDKASIEGTITSDGTNYNINITFKGREKCLLNDVSVHGHFTLHKWLAEQPEIRDLMKRFKMKM
jgi:hypothetical protein